jgi:hypothetical protein
VLSSELAGEALEANRVAVALDRLAWPDLIGAIAETTRSSSR